MNDYFWMTKPGIIAGNLITAAAGFFLASRGKVDFRVLGSMLVGLALVIAGASIFNNILDHKTDREMSRTANRPLAQGRLSLRSAFFLGLFLSGLGGLTLFLATNTLALLWAATGFVVYIALYTLLKQQTVHATLIGSIAGATPPVVGYTAASGSFDLGAFLLFLILVLWQMPHFFAIAFLHLNDYKTANIPLLPLKKGSLKTKIQMTLYIIGLIIVSGLLTLFHYTGILFLGVSSGLCIAWLILCLQGFRSIRRQEEKLWGQKMFRLSLILIMALSLALSFDVVTLS